MTRSGRICGGICFAALTPGLYASKPLDPLPTPCYAFDLGSPQVSPTGPIQADDVLALQSIVPPPPLPKPPERAVVKFDGAELGMGLPGDQLDGLSTQNPGVPLTESFSLLISVDRATTGMAPPEPSLLSMGLPYNVSDQAARGQAAGDLFMSTRLFTRMGMIPTTERLLGGNTALVINNFDEGGTDFAAEPETSANDSSADPQDNVNATAYIDTNGVRGIMPPALVFFSAAAGSPSLGAPGHLPGNSGADIFSALLDGGRSAAIPYARSVDLGLMPGDDIDALLVFDNGPQGELPMFQAGDQVLLSLTAGSPSLQDNGGSAADIISAAKNAAGGLEVTFFARAADFGLGGAVGSPDNVDAIEFFRCTDAIECAQMRGIRRVGDINRNEKVDLYDAHFFWSCFTGPGLTAPAACQTPFDADLDTDVDLVDWNVFRHDMTGPL